MGMMHRSTSMYSTPSTSGENWRTLEVVGLASWSADRTVKILATLVAIQTVLLYAGLPFGYMGRELSTLFANIVSPDLYVSIPQYGYVMMFGIVVVPVAVMALVSAKWQLDRRF